MEMEPDLVLNLTYSKFLVKMTKIKKIRNPKNQSHRLHKKLKFWHPMCDPMIICPCKGAYDSCILFFQWL
jgi:hypothetical protein